MAVYTLIDREELAQIVEDYGLGKLLVTDGIARGSVNTHYLLNTARGKFLLKIDEVKSERRCIAIDILGHGATVTKPGQDVSFAAQARMINEFLDA